MSPEFQGAVLDDAGDAISGATVNLYDVNTTTPSRANTTTDSSGLWSISHATRGRFDVKIVNGSDNVWLRARDRFQFDMAQANSADNVPLTATRSEDAASVQVAIFEGDRATPADGDDAYITLSLSDSAGNQDEQARITWEATTVANGATQDGDLFLSALVNGSLVEMLRLDGSASQLRLAETTVMPSVADTLITGHTDVETIGSSAARVQINNTATGGLSTTHWANNAGGLYHVFGHSRSTTVGTPGTIVQDDDVIGTIEWAGDDGVDLATPAASILAAVDGTPGTNDMPGRLVFSTTADGANTVTERMRIDSAGMVLINESANADMTIGLTINQGASDNQILSFKSSDIATGLSSAPNAAVETDDYMTFQKLNATAGGVRVLGLGTSSAATGLLFESYTGSADTTKTTSANGAIILRAVEHDGSNGLDNMTADGNVFVVQARVGGSTIARMLVDEDGDLYSVTAAQTFDDYDDLALVNAYDGVRAGFEGWATEHEDELIRLGILGGRIKDGGMTNMTQLCRLLTGAVRQSGEDIRQLGERLQIAEARLASLPEGK